LPIVTPDPVDPHALSKNTMTNPADIFLNLFSVISN